MKVYNYVVLDKDSDEPMYIQLYEKMKGLIENGTLEPDTKLPAIRAFSKELEVNSSTIVNAYKLLEQKGFVYSRVGSGTYIRGNKANEYEERNPDFNISENKYLRDNLDLIDFSTSTPNPELFPVIEFKEVLNEVLDRDGGKAFEYQEAQGYYPFRQSIAAYLAENQINTNADNINIISGAQQGIDIVAKSLVEYNDTIVVESPTYTGAFAAFESRGAKIIEVPMMEDGIDTKELENVLKATSPKLIYVMTSFQNPTGVSYSEDKKLQLLYLANKYNTYILEDDYLPELSFYGNTSLPLKALDAREKVIYLKTFSKIFMPGIRLGFLITPYSMMKKIISAKHTTDISSASLMQRAFDLYIRKKKWEKHIDKMFNIYKERHDVFVEALKSKAPFIDFYNPKGGIYIWGKSDLDASILCSAARKNGVLMTSGSLFYLDNNPSNYFRLSYAGIEKDKIINGVELINKAYNDIKNMNVEEIIK